MAGQSAWTRPSASSRTITAKVVMHFFTGGIFPRTQDIQLAWGDGSFNSPSRDQTFLNGTWDATGSVRTIIYRESHTYSALNRYTAYIYSNARQNAILNGPDRPYRIEAGVNLGNSQCLSSPEGIIPGVAYLTIAPKAQFQISAATTNAQALSYSWYDQSYLRINPPIAPSGAAASLSRATPSYSGVLVNWDTSSSEAGSLYAVSVRADLATVQYCHTVWDVTVQLERGSVPQCVRGGGSYTFFTSDTNVRLELSGAAGPLERLDAALIGGLPPGANFSSLVNTGNVTMTWPRPVSGSYAFAVQFCSQAGLCGACSVSINVNNALPRVSVTTTASVTENGLYAFGVVAENKSLDPNSVLTVDNVTSSMDGDLSLVGCPTGSTLAQGGQYSCAYVSPTARAGSENVISVQVSSTGSNGLSSVAGDSSVPALPALSTSKRIATTATATTTTTTMTTTTTASNAGGSTFAVTTGGVNGSLTTVTPTTSAPAAPTTPVCGASAGGELCFFFFFFFYFLVVANSALYSSSLPDRFRLRWSRRKSSGILHSVGVLPMWLWLSRCWNGTRPDGVRVCLHATRLSGRADVPE